jgi:hypothetical protein
LSGNEEVGNELTISIEIVTGVERMGKDIHVLGSTESTHIVFLQLESPAQVLRIDGIIAACVGEVYQVVVGIIFVD